MTMVNRTGG